MFGGRATAGHEARYALAAGFLRPGDVVVDAACGIGYGALILDTHGDITYYGVDRDTSVVTVKEHRRRRFVEADLRSWQPSFEFDVAVGFETIEHLDSYDVYLDWVRRARRHIVVSVPIVPTKDDNVFHVHDFERDDLVQLVTASHEWRLFQYFDQPWEHSCVYVFTRAGVVLAEPHKLGVRRSWKSRCKSLVKSAASFRFSVRVRSERGSARS